MKTVNLKTNKIIDVEKLTFSFCFPLVLSVAYKGLQSPFCFQG